MPTDWAALQAGIEAGEEYKGSDFATLPKGAWVLVNPVNTEDSAWAPELVKVDPGKDGDRSWEGYHRFGVGLRAIGGDAKCNPTHFGAYTRFKTRIDPTDKDPNGSIVSGKLMGFMSAIFANGIEGSERNTTCFNLIKTTAENNNLSEGEFANTAVFVATCVRQAIIDGAPRRLLVKIGHRKFKLDTDVGNEKTGVGVEVRLIEDASQENMDKFGVSIFDNATEVAAESEGSTF